MKNLILTLTIAVIILTTGVIAKAQNNWTFVVFETAVTSENIPTSSENPQERRFYVSNLINPPDSTRSYQLPKIVDDYFTANVVDPMKAKGIVHNYYDSDIKMDCGSILAAKDKQDAEDKRAKCIEDIKEQESVNIYSFNWTLGTAKGLETAQPTLIFRGKDTPNYQPKGEKIATPKVEKNSSETNSTTITKPVNKTKKSKKN